MSLIFVAIAGAEEDRLREMVDGLPELLVKLEKENEWNSAGSTMEMVNFSMSTGDGLLSALVSITLGKDGAEKEREKLRKRLQVDAQAVASDTYFSRNATGSGGSISRLEAAGAYRSHIETRLCYEVSLRYQSDKTFDLERWHKRWAEAGGSLGDPGVYTSENEPTPVSIEEGELRFSNGTSGGSYAASSLATGSFRFSARRGQRLSLATTVINSRVERLNTDGKFDAITEWKRAHDLVLPDSEDGRYQVRFSDALDGDLTAPQLLVEIR